MKNTDFEKVVQQLNDVVGAYDKLLSECRKLSDSVGWREDYILSKVFPKGAKERTDSTRIFQWFETVKTDAIESLKIRRMRNEMEMKKIELIQKYSLSESDLKLLGVTMRTE